MAMIHTIKVGNTVQGVVTVPYTTCSTAAGTVVKSANFTNLTLDTGVTVRIKFAVANTATAPTLSVNSSTAKPIMYNGEPFKDLLANVVYDFVYDGTGWVVLNPPIVWHTF